MLNHLVLIGRVSSINDEPENVTKLIVAVQRSFKNAEGVYENDFVPCIVLNKMASNVKDYCKVGDIIGIKGRLQGKENNLEVVAEKLTFLASKKHTEGEENEYLSDY